MNEEKQQSNPLTSFYEWVGAISAALVAVVLIFMFLCRVVSVDGTSMMNTLENGERLLLSRLPYTPAYEDIVVGDNDEETLSEIIGEEKVKLNETGTYTINKSVDWEIDDLTIATMLSKTDTSIRIKGIKRGWITLKATDQTGTTYEKDIMIC